jgi:hypothetical protein
MIDQRLSYEQRQLLRSQIDQATRTARQLDAERPPTAVQQHLAAEIAALLAANPGRLFSIADISRTLDHSLHLVTRALAVVEDQQRATVVQDGRYLRWKAPARRS